MTRTLILFLVATLALSARTDAHPGGVDKNGCHVEKATGKRHCHPERAEKPKPSCNAPAPKAGDEGVLFGPVVSVTDGDTFKAKIQGVTMKFRLSDLDAPESNQPYGRNARATLVALLGKKDVVMQKVDDDPYGRVVVYAWVGDLNVNRAVMQQGAAWFYSEYAHTDCLYVIEQEARDAKRGLWQLPREQRIEPWNWRQNERSK